VFEFAENYRQGNWEYQGSNECGDWRLVEDEEVFVNEREGLAVYPSLLRALKGRKHRE
jgi:hypothetical protein